MKIGNNFSAINRPQSLSFKKLYIEKPTTYDLMLELSRDENKGDKFQKAFAELNDAAVNDNVQIASLNKGACITRIDPTTQNMVEVLSVSIDDFTWALVQATEKLRTGQMPRFLPNKKN